MLKKNILLSGFSYGLKFFSNAVLMILLARVLGPERFGIIGFAMTASIFLGIIVDYGFSLQITKNIAQATGRIDSEISKIFIGKLIIAISVFFSTFLFFFFLSSETAILVILLTLSMIFYSFGQFFFSIFRGLNRFGEETKFTFIANVILLASLTPIILMHADYAWIAACFLLSRFVYLAAGVKLFLSEFTFSIQGAFTSKEIVRILHEGLPFGMLVGSGYLFLSIDTFFVKTLFDNEAAGVYQSGLRFVFASLVIAESIVAVYLPVLSKLAVQNKTIFQKKAKELTVISLIVAAFLSVFLIIRPGVTVSIILGDAYKSATHLLPLFGVIIILRFLLASYGTILTARGYQNIRTRAVVLALLSFLVLAPLLVSTYGLMGVLTSSVVAHSIMLLLYWRSVQLADKKPYFYMQGNNVPWGQKSRQQSY